MKWFFSLAVLPLLFLSACERPPVASAAAEFTDEGDLKRPDPAMWVFVSASSSTVSDASMAPAGDAMMAAGASEGAPAETKQPEGRFNVIRMDPAAWEAYRKTGEFPEGTVFTTSFYSMHDKGMDAPRYWADRPMGMEVSVKDSKRFPEGWGYFRFEGDAATAQLFPKEGCFDCHAERAAKDNVFTQLYQAFGN